MLPLPNEPQSLFCRVINQLEHRVLPSQALGKHHERGDWSSSVLGEGVFSLLLLPPTFFFFFQMKNDRVIPLSSLCSSDHFREIDCDSVNDCLVGC